MLATMRAGGPFTHISINREHGASHKRGKDDKRDTPGRRPAMPIQRRRSKECRNSDDGHHAGPPTGDGRVFCIRCGRPLIRHRDHRPKFCLFFLLVLACAVASTLLFWLYVGG
jgi:hypothetical protein